MTDETLKMIFNAHNKSLICFATSMVGGLYAEDVVLSCFLKLWNIGDHADPKAFLFGVAKNECLNHLRKERQLKRRERIAFDLSPQFIDAQEIRSELISHIVKEIESLPAGQRKIAKLLSMGYSQVEISEMLDLKPTTIAVQVMRIRKKLQPLNDL